MTRLKQLRRSGQVWVFQLSSALSSFLLLTKMYRYTFLPLSIFYYFSFFSALFLVSFFTEKITWVLITGSSLLPLWSSFCNKTRRSSSKVLQSRKQVLNLVCNLQSLKTVKEVLSFSGRKEKSVSVIRCSFHTVQFLFISCSSFTSFSFTLHTCDGLSRVTLWPRKPRVKESRRVFLAKKTTSERIKKSL